MSTQAQAPAQTSLIKKMADQYGLEATNFKNTIIKTLFPSDKQNVSNEIVAAFLVVADKYQLNPFIKEIYAFPAKGGGIVPIVSIDGWSTLLNRQEAYDGIEFKDEYDENGNVISVTAKIFRKDRSHPTVVTEYMKECRRSTGPWDSHPIRMLRHKALIQCARVAFGFAGIYDEDEGARVAAEAGGFGTGSPEPDPPAPQPISEEQRIALVNLAKEQGVEALGAILGNFGFSMLAEITVDRYEEIVEAIRSAGAPAPTEDGAIVGEVVNPPAAEDPDLDSETENLREYCQEMYDSLDKNAQKDFVRGKVVIGKADKATLEGYKDELETLTARE